MSIGNPILHTGRLKRRGVKWFALATVWELGFKLRSCSFPVPCSDHFASLSRPEILSAESHSFQGSPLLIIKDWSDRTVSLKQHTPRARPKWCLQVGMQQLHSVADYCTIRSLSRELFWQHSIPAVLDSHTQPWIFFREIPFYIMHKESVELTAAG